MAGLPSLPTLRSLGQELAPAPQLPQEHVRAEGGTGMGLQRAVQGGHQACTQPQAETQTRAESLPEGPSLSKPRWPVFCTHTGSGTQAASQEVQQWQARGQVQGKVGTPLQSRPILEATPRLLVCLAKKGGKV